MRQPVEVDIMGQRLTVTSDEDEEHLRKVARYVDGKMRKLAEGQSTATLDLALITALNIASEYWKLQRQQEEVRQAVNRVAQRVLSRLGS